MTIFTFVLTSGTFSCVVFFVFIFFSYLYFFMKKNQVITLSSLSLTRCHTKILTLIITALFWGVLWFIFILGRNNPLKKTIKWHYIKLDLYFLMTLTFKWKCVYGPSFSQELRDSFIMFVQLSGTREFLPFLHYAFIFTKSLCDRHILWQWHSSSQHGTYSEVLLIRPPMVLVKNGL